MQPAILFIEDDFHYAPWNREFGERYGKDFEPLYAETRDEAKAHIAKHGERIAIMFCDMNFPDNQKNLWWDDYGPAIIEDVEAKHPNTVIVATSRDFRQTKSYGWIFARETPTLVLIKSDKEGQPLDKEAYFEKLKTMLETIRLIRVMEAREPAPKTGLRALAELAM